MRWLKEERGKEEEGLARDRSAGPYQLFMLGLCVYVLVALAAQATLDLGAETTQILDYVDFFVSLIFMADFVYNVVTAQNRRRYLYTWGWIDFLSSLPTLDICRWGRAARVFRILRVLRGLRATRILSTFVLEKRTQCALWTAALLAILVTVFSSIAILHLESSGETNIVSAEDALWWSFVTMTTVGYGDRFPVTSSGRLLAGFLMLTGIGLFGTFTAFVASVFLAPGEAEQERELAAIKQELRRLSDGMAQPSRRRDAETPDRR